jgi:hypothetical protein
MGGNGIGEALEELIAIVPTEGPGATLAIDRLDPLLAKLSPNCC